MIRERRLFDSPSFRDAHSVSPRISSRASESPMLTSYWRQVCHQLAPRSASRWYSRSELRSSGGRQFRDSAIAQERLQFRRETGHRAAAFTSVWNGVRPRPVRVRAGAVQATRDVAVVAKANESPTGSPSDAASRIGCCHLSQSPADGLARRR